MPRLFALCTLCFLAACQKPAEQAPPMRPQIRETDGRCFGRDIAPAVIETVTSQVLEAPARTDANGKVLRPARYRSETRQQIARERREITFRTPCDEAFTPQFIASLQRALHARGLYSGADDGLLTPQTGRAIRAYQRDFGPDSAILSLDAAQRLGLISLTPEQLEQLGAPGAKDVFMVPVN